MAVDPPPPDSIEAFLDATTNASFVEVVSDETSRVRDEQEFERMREFILNRYREVEVVGTLRVGVQVFDCVSTGSVSPKNGSPDSGCPPGSIPVRRVTLSELVRYATLEHFYRK